MSNVKLNVTKGDFNSFAFHRPEDNKNLTESQQEIIEIFEDELDNYLQGITSDIKDILGVVPEGKLLR